MLLRVLEKEKFSCNEGKQLKQQYWKTQGKEGETPAHQKQARQLLKNLLTPSFSALYNDKI